MTYRLPSAPGRSVWRNTGIYGPGKNPSSRLSGGGTTPMTPKPGAMQSLASKYAQRVALERDQRVRQTSTRTSKMDYGRSRAPRERY